MNQVFQIQRLFGPLTILTIVLAIPAFFIVRGLNPELVLPAMSMLLFSVAALTAIFAFSTNVARNSEQVTWWDIAGGLALTGCAASILGEPDQVAHLFEHLSERKTNDRN